MASEINFNEVKSWDSEKIEAKVNDLRVEYFNMKMQKVAAIAEKPHRFKEIKKDIARLLTAKSANKK